MIASDVPLIRLSEFARPPLLARKGDGEPGIKTIWQGLERVMTAAEPLRGLRHEAA